MRWPWSKDVDEARQQAVEAAEGHAHAERKLRQVEIESEEAKKVARVLRNELERNGYTELLRQAWGGAS
ncbi:DUF7620 family protein [Rhodococcus sp. BE178]|uniref:DUF7620 family protein n=1 Tax=Rhodococcus sp. BE178 TaxID=2817737 RepID=UPI003D1EA345